MKDGAVGAIDATIHDSRIGRTLCIKLILLSTLFAPSTSIFAHEATRDGDIFPAEYTHAHALVRVQGLRRLNLFCTGHGQPTVIYEAGGGEDSVSFRRVQGRLATITRVCSYDRAGLGFSDASARASSARNIVDDLHHLIENASFDRPVILLGHSSGGLYAALYAATYPNDVAGMVLLDPSFPGQDSEITRDWTVPQKNSWHAEDREDIAQIRKCLALASKGSLIEPAFRQSTCLDNPPDADNLLHVVMNQQLARPGTQAALLSETLDTYPSDDEGFSAAERALRDSHFNFGAKPLIVLTAANQFTDLSTGQRVKAMRGWMLGHQALAAGSTTGLNIIVPNSGHFIMLDQPNVVVRYARRIIDTVRASTQRRSPTD